jgi:uncharacterized hydrophobic protein (TIGR00271 family)
MKNIVLIYDELRLEEVEKNILPELDSNLKKYLPYKDFRETSFSKEDLIVCYLSDQQLHELIESFCEKEIKVGFLPHPEMPEAKQGFGISNNLAKAIEQILTSDELRNIDVLLANGKPILNKLTIGKSFSLLSGSKIEENWWKRQQKKIVNFFKSFQRVKLQEYSLSWVSNNGDEGDKTVNTAALGMVVVQHGRSSIFSRSFIENSNTNDGLFHCLVIAPKSLLEILKFGFTSLFNFSKKAKLPGYVAHLKTDNISISSKDPISFVIDEVLVSAREIKLEVKHKSLSIIPGEFLEIDEEVDKNKIFKVGNLPQGELRNELLRGYLPLTNHATTEEFKWLFTALRENSKVTPSYLVLMGLSTLIAAFGLFGNSSPVIIGAMILAPLMSPIISLAMGVLRQEEKLIKDSLKTIAFGLLIGYAFAVLITWITPLKIPNSEIIARIRPNLLDLGVAAASGVAGAYAHAKKEVAKTLAGVAIAVALVPPLAVSGIGLGWGDWQVFFGALLLLGTNLAGMILAGALTFLVLGFSPFHLAKKGLLISLFLVLMISAPLGFGFSRMVKENKLIQELNGKEIEQGKLRNVNIIQMSPMRISLTVVSETPLDLVDLKEAKEKIEELIGESVELELTVAIRF